MSETRQLKVVIAGDAKSARQALKILGTGLDEADKKSAKASKGSKSLGDSIKGMSAVAGLALGGLVAAAGGLGAAFASAMDFDAVKGTFEAQIGSSKFAGELGSVAGRLYTNNFGASVEDNMNAVRRVMSSGLLTEDASDADIERITGKAQNLAKVFGQDVQGTARAAGQMIRTGLAKNADEAFDILTRGFQQTGDPADDLLDTVNEYGTQFRKLGLDGTTAMGLLQQGLKGGARDTDVVADALKEFSIRAVDGSTLSAQGFKMLGLNAKDMTKQMASGGKGASAGLETVLEKLRGIKDPAKQAQAATALFGTQAEDLGKALFKLDPSTATTSMGKVGGAADKMGKSLNTPGATIESLKRKIQQGITDKLTAALPLIIKVGEWFQKYSGWLMPVVAALGAVGVAIGVVAIATKLYTAYQWLLNFAMEANPIGLIVLALVALVAGLTYAWFHSESFRKALIAIWNAIKHAVLVALVAVKNAVLAAWNWVKNTSVSTWNSVKNSTLSAWRAVTGAISSAISKAVGFVTGMKKKITGAFSAAKTWLLDSGKAIIQGLIDGIKDMAGNVKDAVSGVLKKARDLLPFSPAKEGPFSGKGWTLYSGRSISEGLATGITQRKGSVVNAARSTVSGVADVFAVSDSGVANRAIGAGGGGVNVTVNVRGSVTAERDLAKSIATNVRDEIARNGKRNGGRTGLADQ